VHYVAVPDAVPGSGLRGKALALHTAFAHTDADLWLTTDADCRPPPGWARHVVAYFADPAVGAVSGVTTTTTDTPFAHAQAFDWLYLLGALGFLAERRHPVTAMGNNLALRPAAYRAVGGYPALPFSVTEDYALFRAIYRHPDWRVRSPLDPGLHNRTLPLNTLGELLNQRKRWVRGGLRGAWWLYPIYLAVGLAPLVPLALLFVAPLVGGIALLARLAADATFLRPLARRFGVPWSARAFLRFELLHHFYLMVLPWLLLFRPRIAWKGRVHG
jgi:cellulose synthase/poly-beta-1,6-N-acetylglucosamine synthase-like glycosyltransferase